MTVNRKLDFQVRNLVRTRQIMRPPIIQNLAATGVLEGNTSSSSSSSSSHSSDSSGVYSPVPWVSGESSPSTNNAEMKGPVAERVNFPGAATQSDRTNNLRSHLPNPKTT